MRLVDLVRAIGRGIITLTLKMTLEIWVKISQTDVWSIWVTFVFLTFFHDGRLAGWSSEWKIRKHVRRPARERWCIFSCSFKLYTLSEDLSDSLLFIIC